MMEQATVVAEAYRTCDGSEHATPSAAAKHLYRAWADDKLVGPQIYRVTKHEPVVLPGPLGAVMDPRTETVTGTLTLLSPADVAMHPNLSRYHPNNGWVVPQSVGVDT